MANPIEALMAAPQPTQLAEEPGLTEDAQRQNMIQMDAPIPGQSLTREPGSVPWEQPPEYTTEAEAMDFLFEKVTRPDIQKNLLRALDAGVPISVLMEPILMHGVQEGKWSMDLAMMLMEPLGVVLYGMASRSGITAEIEAPKKKEEGLNPEPLAKIFKKKIKDQEPKESVELPEAGGLLSRPGGAE